MLLGPIFTLELVTSVRRLRYYVVRVAYALILFAILWVSYVESPLYRTAPGELVSHQQMARSLTSFLMFLPRPSYSRSYSSPQP